MDANAVTAAIARVNVSFVFITQLLNYGLRYNGKTCVPGAQTERRGEATRPVR